MFFCNVTATPEIYPLPLHAALPIYRHTRSAMAGSSSTTSTSPPLRDLSVIASQRHSAEIGWIVAERRHGTPEVDRKSTRLNSSHANISYAVFCLKKKNEHQPLQYLT